MPMDHTSTLCVEKDEQGRYDENNIDVRPCFNSKQINGCTLDFIAPMPHIATIFALMSRFTVASVIDLKSAYLQKRMKEADKEKTTFTNPFDGTRWRFVGNTFGPKNTPMRFQNLMETILDGLEGVLVYLDDIIVVSSVIRDHAKQVNDVLNTLTRWNLRVSKSKIHLCYRRLKVLGHILTPEGRSIDPVKVEVGKQFQRPTSGTQLARLIGFFGYLRDYIPLFGRIMAPLEEIKNKRKITAVWGERQERSYQCLTNAVASLPHIGHPAPDVPFQLLTDWSQVAVSGVLVQKVPRRGISTRDCNDEVMSPITIDEMRLFATNTHPRLKLRFIGFFSKAMNAAQRKYPASRGELLGGMLSMRHFHVYLYGQTFYWLTDHKALARLLAKTPPNLYVAHWLETILTYKFHTIYMPGIHMVLPDTLSRIYSQSSIFKKEGEKNEGKDEYLCKIARVVDSSTRRVVRRVRYRNDPEITKLLAPSMQIPNEAGRDELQDVSDKRSPSSLEEQNALVEMYHGFAHTSGKALHHVLWTAGYWWPSMRKMCEKVYRQCESCQRTAIHRVGYNPLKTIHAVYPGDRVGMDLFFLEPDVHGYIGCLVYTDSCTKLP